MGHKSELNGLSKSEKNGSLPFKENGVNAIAQK
jgi:hypothetical protein